MALDLHPLFSPHAVLQRERPLPVYGRTTPGAEVEVELAGAQASSVAGADGSFTVTLPALSAGGPHELRVRAGGETRIVEDVLVGDVWLCSGQSNMQWELWQSAGADAELGRPEDGELRLFYVPLVEQEAPRDSLDARWERSSAQALRRASGVGAFFARHLRAELGVPIGLVMAAWGGTRVAAWIPEAQLEAEDKIPGARQNAPHIEAAYILHPDPGNEGEARGYAALEFDDSSWGEMKLPTMWQDQGEEYNGAVWFRRIFELPSELEGQDLSLDLGAIDDFDVTYVNGTRVGATDSSTPQAYATPRRYRVPQSALCKGKNVIAVRVFDEYGMGGFAGPPGQMRLSADGKSPLPLSGAWRWHAEHRLLPWRMIFGSSRTAGPYNGMIHPLRRSPLRGVLFYQGESDVNRAARYEQLFALMIETWREVFGDQTLPFLFVQLANFTPRLPEPGDSDWAELREAQRQALRLPHTAMAVTIDVGDAVDIHPTDKKTVGTRLALAALDQVYGQRQEYSGPVFRGATQSGGSLRVEFDHARGLRARGGDPVRGFSIAGADGRFFWANAELDGSAAVVSSPHVREPVAVRYGWAANPEVNLENDSGLPASPFRSDDFPLTTLGTR